MITGYIRSNIILWKQFAMSLQVADRLYVLTATGEREIQFCLGDLTKLSPKDQVDVLLISAFPGDYSVTRTSVIGALQHNLQISVRELSYNKKEDLRHKFHCWISHKLPPKLPYKQIICVEKDKKGTPIKDVVKNMFRALMPVFNTENKKVITSLLGTGAQSSKKKEVLEVMVNTAVDWMHMGLPLELLKIVVYTKNPDVLTSDEKECLSAFKWLKKKHGKTSGRVADPTIKEDIFLLASAKDEALTDILKRELITCHKRIKIITSDKVSSKEASWQHDMYLAMTTCARIVPVLTECFLEDEECVDLYNIAMCCNRQLRRNVLSPICTERITELPIYMAMVQWYYCRDGNLTKIKGACENLVEQVKEDRNPKQQHKYDVFISYAHKNAEIAEKLLSKLREAKSNLQIFFDNEELKTGMSWQQSLYTSVESSHCVIALLSSDYMKSAVCNEEFNIALMKYIKNKDKMKLLPVCIEDLESVPFENQVEVQYIKDGDLDKLFTSVCQKATGKQGKVNDQQNKLRLEDCWEDHRRKLFQSFYSFSKCDIRLQDGDPDKPNEESFSILCSFTARDYKYLKMLKSFLQAKLSTVELSLIPASQKEQKKSSCFLIGLSATYFQSKRQTEELHWILSELRQAKGDVTVYVMWLDQLEKCPIYARLIPTFTCIKDALWLEMSEHEDMQFKDLPDNLMKSQREVEVEYGAFQESEVVALLKCVCDLTRLSNGGEVPGTFKNKGVLVNPLPQLNTMNTMLKQPAPSDAVHKGQMDENLKVISDEKVEDNDGAGSHDKDKQGNNVKKSATTGDIHKTPGASVHTRSRPKSANCQVL